MKFFNPDKRLTKAEVDSVESMLGLKFPNALRSLFVSHNGASPEPYTFEINHRVGMVSEILPLISEQGRGTAVDCYRHLVLEKLIVPPRFFPFAVDGGGDYFFTDCDNADTPVFYYRSDTVAPVGERLEKVSDSLSTFWSLMTCDSDEWSE